MKQETINKVENLKARAAGELAIELDIPFKEAERIIDDLVEKVLLC